MKKISAILLILLIASSCDLKTTENKIAIPEINNNNYTEPVNKDIVATPQQRILGSWKNLSHPDQVVTYKTDGNAEVAYSGVVKDAFKWEIISNSGSEVIKESGMPDRFYAISKLDEQNLEIIYQYNNQVLKYTRVQ